MATNSEGEAATETAILTQDEEEKADAQDSDPVLKNYGFEDKEKDSSQQQLNGASREKEEEVEEEGEGEEVKEKEQLVVLEEDGEKEHLGPRDEIKVTVTGYQRTADNCTFDVEV